MLTHYYTQWVRPVMECCPEFLMTLDRRLLKKLDNVQLGALRLCQGLPPERPVQHAAVEVNIGVPPLDLRRMELAASSPALAPPVDYSGSRGSKAVTPAAWRAIRSGGEGAGVGPSELLGVSQTGKWAHVAGVDGWCDEGRTATRGEGDLAGAGHAGGPEMHGARPHAERPVQQAGTSGSERP